MSNPSLARPLRIFSAGLLIALLDGCSALHLSNTSQPSFYALDNVYIKASAEARAMPLQMVPTLIVSAPHAAAGFDTQHIIYVRTPHQLEYYAYSEWVDTPARMIAPLIVSAIGSSGTFRAVVLTPSAAAGDLRLDTEIVRLQHDVGGQPSRVRFTLRAYLMDNTTRQILAWREFDETVAIQDEHPYGVVVAANRAVHNVLEQLGNFCSSAAENWQAPAPELPEKSY